MYTTVNAGLYTRLSVEDENNQISESIQTQKAMLTDYCREKGYRIVDYYVDDGETGTNFERPEFQRMLRDIEAGKINTVICKDLSRFGRNYYEAGMYLDKYFVERNIRFIAIQDAQAKKVLRMEQVGEGVIKAAVTGNGSTYDTLIDAAHPRESQCNCPHASGKRIICKHMVAVYFTAFPAEAKKYITELENYWEGEEQRQQEQEDRLICFVHKMKKSQLQEALLQLLFDGPEWERFVEENLGE